MKHIRVYSAPMAGISDYPFRQMLRQFGNQTLFSEMIGVETLIHGHPKTLKMLTFDKEKDVVVQLVGANPASMAKAAAIVADAGACGIDINMGCPVRKLIQNHSGAMLMKEVDLACRLVAAVKSCVDLPVSVKTRLGWDNAQDFVDFVPALVSAGAERIEIHARTKEMGYQGKADWGLLKALNVDVPVVVNGDIKDFSSAVEALDLSGAEAVMVGRALLGRPWRLTEIEQNCKLKVCLSDVVLRHLDLLLSHYGKAGLYVARKHLAWYATHKKGVAKWREKMYSLEDEHAVIKMIQDFF